MIFFWGERGVVLGLDGRGMDWCKKFEEAHELWNAFI